MFIHRLLRLFKSQNAGRSEQFHLVSTIEEAVTLIPVDVPNQRLVMLDPNKSLLAALDAKATIIDVSDKRMTKEIPLDPWPVLVRVMPVPEGAKSSEITPFAALPVAHYFLSFSGSREDELSDRLRTANLLDKLWQAYAFARVAGKTYPGDLETFWRRAAMDETYPIMQEVRHALRAAYLHPKIKETVLLAAKSGGLADLFTYLEAVKGRGKPLESPIGWASTVAFVGDSAVTAILFDLLCKQQAEQALGQAMSHPILPFFENPTVILVNGWDDFGRKTNTEALEKRLTGFPNVTVIAIR